jgi:GT2 family glycosyltransferase/glycosyltransferase involved in cell wall biosynthesis
MAQIRAGVVSVILVNFRGADDTIEAIRHLGRLDWPIDKLEIVVVENGSGDNSAELIRTAAPHVTLIESKTNEGFAGGCNLGVARSAGEFAAFLNNDARPHKDWISSAVDRFNESSRIGAVASKVLDWDGEKVDYIGAALTWFGMGYKPLTGEPAPTSHNVAKDVLFGTGSAMFIRRTVFDELAGFDERFFMFFEDVDLGWRLNLRGWRFVYEPKSLAFHKHHASMSSFGPFKESYLLERNALFTLYKNLGSSALAEALPASLMLSIRRGISKGKLDSTSLDIRKPGGDAEMNETVPKEALAPVFAIDQFLDQLASLQQSRDAVQGSRVVSEARMRQLFGYTDAPSYQGESYTAGYETLVNAFGVLDLPESPRVLVVTGDPIGAKMAGPAIRAWHIAEALALQHSVTLVSTSGVAAGPAAFDVMHVRPGDQRTFSALEKDSDVIIFQGHAMAMFDALRATKKVVVVDIYDPMHLEQLEQSRELGNAAWTKQVQDATDVLNEQLARGDFFLCASERQRHFYLGQLAALGRINPANYEDDPDLSGLIAVVPFGLDNERPQHKRKVLKGVVPGIEDTDKVVLWSGGLYNWFDPKTLIRAMAQLAQRHDDVRLFFQGTKHPHPGVPEMAIVAESRALAAQLGVLDRVVFFNDSWVDYADRQNYLTEADVGVSTHFSHVETTFSFRTRILDYLWAELPMVVTAGDHFAELIARESLGIVVPAEDHDALAGALEKALYDEEFAADVRLNVSRVSESYTWENTLRPLLDFVQKPRRARDLVESTRGAISKRPARKTNRRRKRGFRHDVGLVAFYLRNGGPITVLRKIHRRIRNA